MTVQELIDDLMRYSEHDRATLPAVVEAELAEEKAGR